MACTTTARTTSRPSSRLIAAGSVAATCVGLLVAAGSAGAARTPAGDPTPGVTRAALDPALVAGRGAAVDFVEQEAENAGTNGTVIGPSRAAYTLPAEASGRSAVQLARRRSTSSSRCPAAANAITVRYSIPDAPTGGGITAPLDVTANGGHGSTMTLTSQYAWLYNQYPFTNDPNADLLHPDWWITECSCVPDQTTPTPMVTNAVPAQPLLRRAAPAARPDLPRRRHGSGSPCRPAARPTARHRPARLAAGRPRRRST